MRDRNNDGKQGFDTSISDRRRLYPRDLPFTDLDFMGLGYARHKAKFLIEWKTWGSWRPDDAGQQANHDALFDLANRASLPAFVVMVSKADPPQQWTYTVCQSNLRGDLILGEFLSPLTPEPQTVEYQGRTLITLDEEVWLRFEFMVRDQVVDVEQIAGWKLEADLTPRIKLDPAMLN